MNKKELLKKAFKHVKLASDIIVTIDILLHGYRLYKDFISPRLTNRSTSSNVSADETISNV